MEEKVKKVILYTDMMDSLSQIEDENERYKAWYFAADYFRYGEVDDTDLSPVAKIWLSIYKPFIDKTRQRVINGVSNGQKGGATIGNQNAAKKGKGEKTKYCDESEVDVLCEAYFEKIGRKADRDDIREAYKELGFEEVMKQLGNGVAEFH